MSSCSGGCGAGVVIAATVVIVSDVTVIVNDVDIIISDIVSGIVIACSVEATTIVTTVYAIVTIIIVATTTTTTTPISRPSLAPAPAECVSAAILMTLRPVPVLRRPVVTMSGRLSR